MGGVFVAVGCLGSVCVGCSGFRMCGGVLVWVACGSACVAVFGVSLGEHRRGLFGITWVGRLSRVLAVRAFLGLCRVSGRSFVVWSVWAV